MRPNKLQGQTLEGKAEINAAITACGVQGLMLADVLGEIAYPSESADPISQEIELSQRQTEVVVAGLRLVARRRQHQEGSGNRSTAKQMLRAYNAHMRRTLKSTN